MAGTSTVAMVDEKLQVDLVLLYDIIALHAMDVSLEYSVVMPA